MGDGRRALVVKWFQSDMEKKELLERREKIKFEQREKFVKTRRLHLIGKKRRRPPVVMRNLTVESISNYIQ